MEKPIPSEKEIFAEALRLSTPEERAAYLKHACGDDAQLRQRIEALFEAHEEAGEFLQKPPAGVSAKTLVITTGMIPMTEKPGDKIGRYKLREQIGEGGCGVVYVADQEEPVRRRVALKVIKLGMDTKQVVARFEAERQALALMDHPHIAKVLDGGATDTGRPYFVMELVRGIKITDYCDKHNLSTEERLKLFIQVCSAIQHAHQKGIIHRDIKPSNILVTLHDGTPVPKVIDFGIAKATTDQRLTDKTIYTAFEQFIGTPAYMSPEQAEMSGLDIDTRSDIYSLGVLLYELLTGQTPFDAATLLKAGLDQMRRIIREQEPQRPSTRLSTLEDADLTVIASHRRAEAPKLVNLMRGDLDWIVMKSLEKDRIRRYETATGFAQDILRHLKSEPVTARPPSSFYRFQKLLRRNRLAFAASMTITVLLTIGLTVFLKERETHRRAIVAEEARIQERLRASKLQERAAQETRIREIDLSLFELRNYRETDSNSLTCVNLTLEKLTLLKALRGDEDLVVAFCLSDFGHALKSLKRWGEAEGAYSEALEIKRKLLGKEDRRLAMDVEALADVREEQGKWPDAEAPRREAVKLQLKFFSDDNSSLPNHARERLAGMLEKAGKLQEAELVWREIVGVAATNNSQHSRFEVEHYRNRLADVLGKQGKDAEVIAILTDPEYTASTNVFGAVFGYHTQLIAQARFQEADRFFGRAVTNASRDAERMVLIWGQVESLAGRNLWKDAAALEEQVLALDPEHSGTYAHLTLLYVALGDDDRYRQLCRAMFDKFSKEASPGMASDIALRCLIRHSSGVSLHSINELAEKAIAVGTNDGEFPRHQFCKGLSEYRQGDFEKAAEWTQKALEKSGADYARDLQAYSVLAMARHRLKQFSEASEALSKATNIANSKLSKLDGGNLGKDWRGWIIAHTLFREAKALIEDSSKKRNEEK